MSDADYRVTSTESPRRGMVAYRLEPQQGSYFAIHVMFSIRLGAPVVDVVRAERPFTPTQATVFASALTHAAQLASGDHGEKLMTRAAALHAEYSATIPTVNPNPWREQVQRSEE